MKKVIGLLLLGALSFNAYSTEKDMNLDNFCETEEDVVYDLIDDVVDLFRVIRTLEEPTRSEYLDLLDIQIKKIEPIVAQFNFVCDDVGFNHISLYDTLLIKL